MNKISIRNTIRKFNDDVKSLFWISKSKNSDYGFHKPSFGSTSHHHNKVSIIVLPKLNANDNGYMWWPRPRVTGCYRFRRKDVEFICLLHIVLIHRSLVHRTYPGTANPARR